MLSMLSSVRYSSLWPFEYIINCISKVKRNKNLPTFGNSFAMLLLHNENHCGYGDLTL